MSAEKQSEQPLSEQEFLYSLPNDPEDALALFEARIKTDSWVTDSYGGESFDEDSYETSA